jgi:hypothetical protein
VQFEAILRSQTRHQLVKYSRVIFRVGFDFDVDGSTCIYVRVAR